MNITDIVGRVLDLHAYEWDCGTEPISIRITEVHGFNRDGDRLHVVGHELRTSGEQPRMNYWILRAYLPAILERSYAESRR